jgi:hypothetical protein
MQIAVEKFDAIRSKATLHDVQSGRSDIERESDDDKGRSYGSIFSHSCEASRSGWACKIASDGAARATRHDALSPAGGGAAL